MKYQQVLIGIQYFFPLKTRLKPIEEKNNVISKGFNGNSIFLPIKNPIQNY